MCVEKFIARYQLTLRNQNSLETCVFPPKWSSLYPEINLDISTRSRLFAAKCVIASITKQLIRLQQILKGHSFAKFFSHWRYSWTPSGSVNLLCRPTYLVYAGICLPIYLLGSLILAGIHDENAYPRRTRLRGRLGLAVRSDTQLPAVVKVCPGGVIPTRSDIDDRWRKKITQKVALLHRRLRSRNDLFR